MGKVKNILDYVYNQQGVIETLGTITPEAVSLSRREKILRLHNLTYLWWYARCGHTAYELRIDFDPKKHNTLYYDEIHKFVRGVFRNHIQHKASYVLMREWGTKGERLHYHGLILFHDEENQTHKAKVKLELAKQFGKRSKITILKYPLSYIPYMYKRFLSTEEPMFSSEIINDSNLISMVHSPNDPIAQAHEFYKWEDLEKYREQRNDKKAKKPTTLQEFFEKTHQKKFK